MPQFRNLEELKKHLQRHPEDILKNLKEDYLNLPCPKCGVERKVKNLRNDKGEVRCMTCNTVYAAHMKLE